MSGDAVLLMAYGGPDRLDQVEAYYTDIRRGSPPPPHLLQELLERYRLIGGRSPLSDVVERQRAALERELAVRGRPMPVFAGMRHIDPRIGAVVRELAAGGSARVAAIALAPQQSSNADGYRRALEAGLAEVVAPPEARIVASWHDTPKLIEALAAGAARSLARFASPDSVHVLYTAHSLPERVIAAGDRYPDEVSATAALVAAQLGRKGDVDVAFQSAGRTGEPWIGPELLERLRQLAADGVRDVLVVPVGFVADHLEVLYDIDIQAQELAAELGLHLERSPSLNDHPTFIAALADVAIAALDQP
jgi:protoporphyrin/coproporphyrin ferrochelatase